MFFNSVSIGFFLIYWSMSSEIVEEFEYSFGNIFLFHLTIKFIFAMDGTQVKCKSICEDSYNIFGK